MGNPRLDAWLNQVYETLKRLDARYYPQEVYVDAAGTAAAPVLSDSRGYIGAGMVPSSDIDHSGVDNTHNLTTDIDHGSIAGLTDDDHAQYHNDTRGDARYFKKTEHLAASAGVGDAGKPIKLNASGKVDKTMITGTGQAHIADASTTHAITDPADSPADADTLRDDLVLNTIPNIETKLNAIGTILNAVLVRLETAEINLTS